MEELDTSIPVDSIWRSGYGFIGLRGRFVSIRKMNDACCCHQESSRGMVRIVWVRCLLQPEIPLLISLFSCCMGPHRCRHIKAEWETSLVTTSGQ
jgi:hypothetical protein